MLTSHGDVEGAAVGTGLSLWHSAVASAEEAFVLLVLFEFAYVFGALAWRGRTLGKALLDVQVRVRGADLTLSPCGAGRVAVGAVQSGRVAAHSAAQGGRTAVDGMVRGGRAAVEGAMNVATPERVQQIQDAGRTAGVRGRKAWRKAGEAHRDRRAARLAEPPGTPRPIARPERYDRPPYPPPSSPYRPVE